MLGVYGLSVFIEIYFEIGIFWCILDINNFDDFFLKCVID